jgi:CRISPR-associated endonuclease/helicase Cas3
MAREFGKPFGYGDEAYCAGLFHDLGKYGHKFQRRLRGHGSGINLWTAGVFEAYQIKAQSAAFAIDGDHKGIPKLADLQNLLRAYHQDGDWSQFGIQESMAALAERASGDGVALPTERAFGQFSKPFFAAALHTCFLFSCLVDADFLDT